MGINCYLMICLVSCIIYTGNIVSLSACVWFFSTMSCQMSTQTVWKITYVLSKRFFLPCVFKCVCKWYGWEDAWLHWLHLYFSSPLCVFKCLLKLPPSEIALSHWSHLFDYSLCIFKWVWRLPAQEDTKSHWLHFFTFLQMFPQLVLVRWYISTYVKFVPLFPNSMWHFFYFSRLCLSIWVRKLMRWEDVKLCRLHLFDSPPVCVFKWVLKLSAWEGA